MWLSGVYSNLIIASVCIIFMQFTDGNVKNFFVICCATNISLVFANLSPLLPLDGYFVLSTLLKCPNLRKGSFQQFKKWVFRKDNKFSGLFVLYFGVTVCFYIAIALYEIRWVANVIINGISNNYSFSNYLYEFRLIILILSVILGKKIFEIISKIISKGRMIKV